MFKATLNLTTSSTVRDAIFMLNKISPGFVVEHRLVVNPLYTERQARCNIFLPQIMKPLVSSSVHQEHSRQAVMAFADLGVFVAAVGEEAIHSLFDHLDLDCLSCFHLPTNLPAPAREATVFLNYF